MQDNNSHRRLDGMAHALGAHAIWGSMPLYLLLVKSVPAFEFVAWRLVFTLPLCLTIIAWRKNGQELRATMANWRVMLTLMGSALMIGINWFLYVWSIQNGHIYAASLGYYVLPLTMMLLGLIFLRERLTHTQWFAVGLATIGVTALAAGALTTLWLSLGIAITFGIYGLLRKTVAAGPLVGLTLETLILYPIALAIIVWHGATPAGSAITQGWGVTLAMAGSGPMTAMPLLLFATAARKMPYTVIGFLQFLSPTVVFLLGLLFFGEALNLAQLACFITIWAAAALFSVELFRARRVSVQS